MIRTMKNLNLLFLSFLSLMHSCESSIDKQRKEQIELHSKIRAIVENYILKSLGEVGDGDKVDTIDVYRIDTLTAKMDSTVKRSHILSALDLNLRRLETQQKLAQLNVDQATLTRSLDQSLHDIAKRDAQDEIDKSNKMLEEVNKLKARLENIDSLINHGKIDSVTQTGYLVHFNIKGRDKKGVARNLDSLSLPLDMGLRILEGL